MYGVQRGHCNALVISDQELAHEVMHKKFDCFYARDVGSKCDLKVVGKQVLVDPIKWEPGQTTDFTRLCRTRFEMEEIENFDEHGFYCQEFEKGSSLK